MDAEFQPDDYRPFSDEALLELVVEPPKTAFPGRGIGLCAALVVLNFARMGHVHGAAAVALPTLFFYLGLRVLTVQPVRTLMRFFESGIELSGEGRAWLRVPWSRIKRVVRDATGGGSLDTGTPEENGRRIAHLPKEQLEELLASAVLPNHVVLVEPPSAEAPKSGGWRTLVLWVFLLCAFLAIWELVKR